MKKPTSRFNSIIPQYMYLSIYMVFHTFPSYLIADSNYVQSKTVFKIEYFVFVYLMQYRSAECIRLLLIFNLIHEHHAG